MCIQTGKTLDDTNRMRMETRELYVKSEDEMRRVFPEYADAIERTEEVAKRCHVDFVFGETKLPRFPTEAGETSEQMFRRLCEKGLTERYQPVTPEARDRMEYEIGVISKMGYVDYFLIVWDFINYARSQGIVVGPGRGSGAGSIVAYCMYITQLDPLRYSLLFERFLNPERVSMPDIDVDFCYERRQEVIDYVARRYGADHVSQIITFGTMSARAVVRDVGRVLGYPYAEVDAVSKSIPFELNMTLARALEISPELKKNYQEDARVKRLIDTSRALEGLPRHASTHAAAYGVVAVRTGWLKRHYPVQFFAALLNSVSSDSGKVAEYSQYCRKHGIPLLPPDINQSVRKFSVGKNAEGVSGIRFGLGAIKSCGDKAIDSIIEQRRRGGPYKDIFDFCTRMDSEQVNKRVVESLILSGAMDCTGAKRTQLMAVYERALDGANKNRRSNVAGQLSLFGDGLLDEVKPTLPDIPEYNLRMMLSLEKNVTGLYISGHPLGDYGKALSALDMNTARLAELLEAPDHGLSSDGMRVRMGGMLTEVRQKATKAGNLMGFATLEDLTGTIEALVFPKVLERVSTELMPDTAVVLGGRLSVREEEDPKLLLDTVEPLYTDAELSQMSDNGALSPAVKQLLPGNTLYLRLPSDSAIGMIQPVLQRFSGPKPVILYIESTGAKLRAPQNLFISPTQELIDTLSDMLGAKNVVLK